MIVLKTKKDSEGWWFESPDQSWCVWCGPYETKAEMLSDKQGVERTINSKAWESL